MSSDVTKALLKALEDGKYNAKPSKLRQGCIFGWVTNPDGSYLREFNDEELEAIWAKIEKEREALQPASPSDTK